MANKKSGYLQREKEYRRALVDSTQHIERQRCFDCFAIAMRRAGYSYKKIKEIYDISVTVVEEFAGAYRGGTDPDADYLRVKMDEALAEFIAPHQEFVPFEERYPSLRSITIDGKLGD